MFKIVRKEVLNPNVTLMEIEAPFVAKKVKAGQFIILRIDEMCIRDRLLTTPVLARASPASLQMMPENTTALTKRTAS